MRRSRCSQQVFPIALAALLLLAGAGAAEAQLRRDFHSGMGTAIGYAGVLPDALAGAGVWHMVSTRYGIFADGKMTPTSRRDHVMHCPPGIVPCTVEHVESTRNDIIIRDDDEYLIFNAGAMYAITPEFMFMLGGGAARTRSVREYFDESEDPITETGQYFVDHSPDPETTLQLVAGMLLRAGDRLAFRFGYETAPGGMSVGAYFVVR